MRTAVCFRIAALAIAGCLSESVTAQGAVLAGTVRVFGDTNRAVPNADIELIQLGVRAQSDSLGRFRITGLAAGEHRLRVRRLGFDSATVSVRLSADAETAVAIAMKPTPTVLKTVTINGQQVTFPARYGDAYARVARSTGQFFTREWIERQHPLDVRSLLQTIPGVHVSDRVITFQRCNGSVAIPQSISQQSRRSASMEGQESMGTAHVHVYVDGTRLTRYSSDPTSPFNFDAEHALRDINPASIQLMEVYTGVSRIPGEYLDDACAVILIWTR